MVTVTNSKINITICNIESIECDLNNHVLIINNYEMEKIDILKKDDQTYAHQFDCDILDIRDKIIELLHKKKNIDLIIIRDIDYRLDIVNKKYWRSI